MAANVRWWQYVILGGFTLAIIFLPFPAVKAQPVEHTFYIDARRFEYAPAILWVNPGDTVTIILATNDVMHGLSIDGYGFETMTQPGRTGKITFVASRTGVFRFHCTVVFGNMHPFMTGKLVVGQNTVLLRSLALLGLAMFTAVWRGRK